MKSIRQSILLSVVMTALLLSACGKRDILDYRNAQFVNGKVYSDDANKPFSGTLTNTPDSQVLIPQQGFQKFAFPIGNTVYAALGNMRAGLGISSASMVLSGAFCDVQVSKGVLDGKATCKMPQSDHVQIEMSFSNGTLDGPFTLYVPDNSRAVFSETTFSNGLPDGEQKIYSVKTHRLIHSVHWANGGLNGAEEGFDESTGKRILLGMLVNGRYDGAFTRYAPDGEHVIRRGAYVQGQPDGSDESFDAQTGKQTGQETWSNGKLHGVARRWDADGKLLDEKTYENGVEVQPSQTNQPSADALPSSSSVEVCVESWTSAYRKERGAEAIVAADQITEWQSWCKQDKHPG